MLDLAQYRLAPLVKTAGANIIVEAEVRAEGTTPERLAYIFQSDGVVLQVPHSHLLGSPELRKPLNVYMVDGCEPLESRCFLVLVSA
jgi:hypothetical protein